MFSVELAAPIDDNITTVYIGNYTDDGTALTVNCIVERNPYREEFIPLWSGEVYQKMSGYTEEDIANSIRDYYGNDRNLVEPSYLVGSEANWDGFNAAILSDTVFNQTTGAVFAQAPSVAIALPSALSQVSTNGVAAFNLVFTNFCLIGQVSAQQRNTWADTAESFNLPSEFVAVVRGNA